MVLVAAIAGPKKVSAQTPQPTITQTILGLDSLFWNAYNSCDDAKFRDFFSEDIEFYHDKGGITNGLDKMMESFKNNLCTPGGIRIRRVAVPGTLQVYPMHKSDTVYGAILSGDHLFYVTEQGKTERLDGKAKFTHLWRLENGAWRMVRVLSYDHGPATYQNTRKAITLTSKELSQFAGQYTGDQTKDLQISISGARLVLTNNERQTMLYPETANTFFLEEKDLIFEFVKNSSHKVAKLIVRENGHVVEELERKK